MPLEAHIVVALAAVVVGSAAIQGFTGFGFGLVGMAFCVPMIGPRDANVLWSVLAMLLVAALWYHLRRHTRWGLVLSLAAGSLAGMPLGVWVLAHGGEEFLSRFVGAAIIVFGTYSLFNPHFAARDISPYWGLPAGALAGFFSGVTSMGGPAVVIYMLLRGLEKDEMKANLAAYFSVSVLYKLALLGGTGLLAVEHLAGAGLLALPLLGGMGMGLYGARFVSSRAMRRVVCAFLMVPGALLLFT